MEHVQDEHGEDDRGAIEDVEVLFCGDDAPAPAAYELDGAIYGSRRCSVSVWGPAGSLSGDVPDQDEQGGEDESDDHEPHTL